VWTASTLKWLAPLIFIISIAALFLVAVLPDNGVGFAVAFGISIGIIALALDNEIKDKSQWMSPIFRTIGHTLLGS
jgi:multisubunit Na+/H+ antiporter MnhB subunit